MAGADEDEDGRPAAGQAYCSRYSEVVKAELRSGYWSRRPAAGPAAPEAAARCASPVALTTGSPAAACFTIDTFTDTTTTTLHRTSTFHRVFTKESNSSDTNKCWRETEQKQINGKAKFVFNDWHVAISNAIG